MAAMWVLWSLCLCLIGREGIALDWWRVLRIGCFSSTCVIAKWAFSAFGLACALLEICAFDNMLVTCSFGLICLLHAVLAQIRLHTFSDQHMWISSNNHPMLTFIPSDARLLHDSWRSKWINRDCQQPIEIELCRTGSYRNFRPRVGTFDRAREEP